MLRALAFASLCALCGCAARPSAPVAAPRTGLTGAAFETLRSLSDEVGPRLAGSEGDRAAVQWGLRTMRAAGLASVRAEPVRVPRWERGAESAVLLDAPARPLAVAALGGSVPTPPEGLEAEVQELSSLDALRALPAGSARGRILFVNVPTERARTGAGYGRAVGARWRSAALAARAGAVAVLVRSIGTDAGRLPHTGAMGYEEGTERIPAAALSVADAELLHRRIAQGPAPRVRLALGCRELPEADSANVVGEVRGTDLAQEVVLLGAHLDSWDLGRGAVDDGAGCALVLTAARYVRSRGAPRRTLRVVFFANEENGGAGARAYAEAHRAELGSHVVALEADAGEGRVFGARYGGAPGRRGAYEALLGPVLRPWGVSLDAGEAHGGADLSGLHAAGVPVLDLRQEMLAYFDIHHTAGDVPEAVDREALEQSSYVYGLVADALARTGEGFGRAEAR